MTEHLARFPSVMMAVALAISVLACSRGDESYSEEASVPTEMYEGEGYATAAVEERINLSNVVVKARLTRAEDGLLRFRAIEYKKGSGPNTFSVKAKTEGRDTQWDDQDAILFLVEHDGSGADFEFTDTAAGLYWGGENAIFPVPYRGSLPEGYTVVSNNPVWLPVSASSGSQRSGLERSTGGGQEEVVVTEYDSSGTPKTLSETSIDTTLTWMAGPQFSGGAARGASGNDVSETDYRNCINEAVFLIQMVRDLEAYYGRPILDEWEHEIASGAERGTVVMKVPLIYPITKVTTEDIGYDEYPIFGHDAHLFNSVVSDSDSRPMNGYSYAFTTKRPLPAGTFRFKSNTVFYTFRHCEYEPDKDELAAMNTVTVTTPPGTVHEAFFDPATTTAGVGYLAGSATSTGVLQPATFSQRDRDINITGLEWRNGQVVVSFDRTVRLSESLTFIELDGTVGLYLSRFDATEDLSARTATWDVPERPWEPGDELMLRMGPIPLPGVRNLTAEANSAGEAVLRWEVAYRAGVSGYRIWRHRPGIDEGPRIYVSDTLSTDTTYTDANSPVPTLTEYRVQAIDRSYNAGESSEAVRVGGP